MKTSKTLLLSRGGQRWTRRALSSTLPRFLPGTRNHLSVFYLPSRTMGHLVKGIFLLPLFLTFWRDERARRKNAPTVWPRTGHGWVILISGLHTPLGPVHDYFGSRTGQYSTLTILRPMVVRPIFFSLFFLSFSLSLIILDPHFSFPLPLLPSLAPSPFLSQRFLQKGRGKEADHAPFDINLAGQSLVRE